MTKSTHICTDKAIFSDSLRHAHMADNTRRVYGEGWALFADWCTQAGCEPLAVSPQDLVDFFTELALRRRKGTEKPLAYGTLMLVRCAVRRRYADANLTSPTHHPEVTNLFRGLARLRGTKPRRANALREDHMAAILACCPPTARGARDAAVLAIGFAAALRRSELCGLSIGDIERFLTAEGEPSGIILHIRRSKTDQAGRGQQVAVPAGKRIRPVAVLDRWLRIRGSHAGPLFQSLRRGGRLTGRPLHHSDIPRLVKQYAAAIGLDPAGFSAHSLRAGFVTSAAVHHARMDKIMAVTRHTNTNTVMKYIRDAAVFTDHAGQEFL